jgi:hypothetical protein
MGTFSGKARGSGQFWRRGADGSALLSATRTKGCATDLAPSAPTKRPRLSTILFTTREKVPVPCVAVTVLNHLGLRSYVMYFRQTRHLVQEEDTGDDVSESLTSQPEPYTDSPGSECNGPKASGAISGRIAEVLPLSAIR